MGAPGLLQHLRGAGFRLSVLEGDRIRVAPAGALSDEQREAIRAYRAELLALLRTPPAVPDLAAVAWSDADIALFNDRRARLIRWGWPEAEADDLAERLTLRDREGDDRVSCADCRHYRRGRCGNHAQAGIGRPEVGRELAGMLQRCRGFDAAPSA